MDKHWKLENPFFRKYRPCFLMDWSIWLTCNLRLFTPSRSPRASRVRWRVPYWHHWTVGCFLLLSSVGRLSDNWPLVAVGEYSLTHARDDITSSLHSDRWRVTCHVSWWKILVHPTWILMYFIIIEGLRLGDQLFFLLELISLIHLSKKYWILNKNVISYECQLNDI